jgi:hypothetical protein
VSEADLGRLSAVDGASAPGAFASPPHPLVSVVLNVFAPEVLLGFAAALAGLLAASASRS